MKRPNRENDFFNPFKMAFKKYNTICKTSSINVES